MSKDTPEVGDIWETDLHICYIINITDNMINAIYRNKPYYSGIKYYTLRCNDDFFKALWKFKCKSKTSLDDLFKTENEE